ncbi:MAG: DUF4367 domain-containing protein [Actinomycetota bacterium]|nr:DUF4367 domain-containing protein [Actinomycetota bacterium]
MIDLERSLGELADRLEIPGGDWLVSDVVRRIGEPARRPARRREVRLAGALVAVVVVAVVALPGPRRAVARWLGFDSVRIEPGVSVPTTTVSPTSLPSAVVTAVATTVVEPDLDLGPSVSIAEAMSQTGLPDPTPALLGAPQSIHIVQPPEVGQIMMVYPPSDLVPQSAVTGVGALVSVMPATIDEGFFQKSLGTDATVRAVTVDGSDGYWIEGSPHQLLFQFGDQIQNDTLRLATNTLLWQRDGHVYRIEADISLETALRIAESVA